MKYVLLITALCLSAGNIMAQTRGMEKFRAATAPTEKGTDKDEFFGTTVHDPYRWLEDDRSEATERWVSNQVVRTNAYFAEFPGLQQIQNKLTSLWNYEKYSAPFKEGLFTYFYKNNGVQNQYVLYRQKDDGGEPEVFLDPNEFSKDGTTSLAGIEFTKDGSLCAFQISEGGSDWRKVIILNTDTRKMVGDTLYDVKFSGLSWKGNDGFYYSSYDKPKGSQLSEKTQIHKLYYHKLGTKQSEDKLIFGGEATPRRYVGGGVTEDQRFLIISASNTTSGNELYIQSLETPGAKIVPVVTGFETEQDVILSEGDKLYILTNMNAPNRRLVSVAASNPSPKNWKDVIPENKMPLTVTTGGGKFFAQYLKDAVSQVMMYNLDGQLEQTIELPGLGTASGFSGKRNEDVLYYTYTSYVYPPTIFWYSIKHGRSREYKRAGVNFDPSKYESKQVFYTSKDGTRVPMILTYKKGLQMNGKNPVLLYGYGGFNVNLTPSFSVSNIILMDMGGIYAVANLRGGGEYGDDWHNAGTKLKKQNVFDDFIAAAEYLIKEKYTSKDYLAIAGGSNGGLLVGACMTQRPDLYKVCFPAVGVLDMLRYHKFTAGAGWAYDYGTAEDSKEMFKYLYKYSPLHAIKPGTCYPATMITTADHDDRVVPAHSFKFAAAMIDAQGCDNPILIRIETNAGHGAGKPTDKIIKEQADKWAFMFYNMGLTYHD
jgi:prolyl oligopeptidase